MASLEDYRIPWKPLDIATGISGIIDERHKQKEEARAEENAKTQREFAEQNRKIQASKEFREERAWKDMLAEREKNDAIQKAAAIPGLMLAVRNASRLYGPEGGAQIANQIGAPFGVKFNAQSQQASPLMQGEEGPLEQWQPGRAATPLSAAANMAPAPQAPQEVGPPPGMETDQNEANLMGTHLEHGVGTTVPEPNVFEGGPANVDLPPVTEAPPEPSPEQTTGQFHTAEGQGFDAPTTHVLMAQFLGGGKAFAIPTQAQGLGLGGKYDQMYNSLVDAGWPEDKAREKVFATNLEDTKESGREKRLTDAIAGRDTSRSAHEDFIAEQAKQYHLTAAQQEALRHESNRALATKAAADVGSKQESANDRAMSLLERRGAAIRQTGQYAKLAAEDKTVNSLMANIADGTTPLQHKDAQIQLARFFRNAQPTEGEMHMLYNNLGGTMDKWNQFKQALENGDLDKEQMRQLRASAETVTHEHKRNVENFVNSAKAGLGPQSGFDLAPDQAQQMYNMLTAELGFKPGDLPPLYQTEGGITIGSKKAPKAVPKMAPEDKAAIAWAQSHRGDPRAKKILQMHGM